MCLTIVAATHGFRTPYVIIGNGYLEAKFNGVDDEPVARHNAVGFRSMAPTKSTVARPLPPVLRIV